MVERSLTLREASDFYHDGGVAGGEGEDVGAGDGGPAGGLHLGLDGVDDLEAAHGVGVGPGALLAGEGRRVVQQDGAVASLATKQAKASANSASTSAPIPPYPHSVRCGGGGTLLVSSSSSRQLSH